MLLLLSEARWPQHRPPRTHGADLGLGVLPRAVPTESHMVGIRKPGVWLSTLPSPSPGPSFCSSELGTYTWKADQLGLERTLPRSGGRPRWRAEH